MRTHHNNSAVCCFLNYHLFSCKKRLVCDCSHHLYDCSSSTEHKYFSFCHCTVKCGTEYFNICVIDCVDNDFIETCNSHQLCLNFVNIHIMNIFQRDAGYICCLIFSLCLLFNIFRHSICGIPKGLIFCKFCLICRNQFFTVFYIVYVVNGKSSALFKKWTHNFPIDRLSCIFLIIRF